MCGGGAWEEEGWQLFADLARELTVAADADAPLVRETAMTAAARRSP